MNECSRGTPHVVLHSISFLLYIYYIYNCCQVRTFELLLLCMIAKDQLGLWFGTRLVFVFSLGLTVLARYYGLLGGRSIYPDLLYLPCPVVSTAVQLSECLDLIRRMQLPAHTVETNTRMGTAVCVRSDVEYVLGDGLKPVHRASKECAEGRSHLESIIVSKQYHALTTSQCGSNAATQHLVLFLSWPGWVDSNVSLQHAVHLCGYGARELGAVVDVCHDRQWYRGVASDQRQVEEGLQHKILVGMID